MHWNALFQDFFAVEILTCELMRRLYGCVNFAVVITTTNEIQHNKSYWKYLCYFLQNITSFQKCQMSTHLCIIFRSNKMSNIIFASAFDRTKYQRPYVYIFRGWQKVKDSLLFTFYNYKRPKTTFRQTKFNKRWPYKVDRLLFIFCASQKAIKRWFFMQWRVLCVEQEIFQNPSGALEFIGGFLYLFIVNHRLSCVSCYVWCWR